MPAITLLTPTQDRPVAFALCEHYMARQTFAGEIEWIVCDSGMHAVECHLGQTHLKRPWTACPRTSFRHNMLALIESASHERILFIEDDDWYRADYVAHMAKLLDVGELVGERDPRYYNVRHRMWSIHQGNRHASLCQTGIKGADILAHVEYILRHDKHPQTLDGGLWKRRGIESHRKLLLPQSLHAVGIKAMPGRAGLGIDHSLAEIVRGKHSGGVCRYEPDPSASKLREWIGGDADAYLEFYQAAL